MIVGLRKVIYLHIWWIRWYSDLQYLWMDEMRSYGKKEWEWAREKDVTWLNARERERDWSTMVSKVTMHKNIFHKRPQMRKSIGRNGWNRSNWYSTWVIVKLMYDYDILYPTPRIQLSVRSFVCPNFLHASYIVILMGHTTWAPNGREGRSQAGP